MSASGPREQKLSERARAVFDPAAGRLVVQTRDEPGRGGQFGSAGEVSFDRSEAFELSAFIRAQFAPGTAQPQPRGQGQPPRQQQSQSQAQTPQQAPQGPPAGLSAQNQSQSPEPRASPGSGGAQGQQTTAPWQQPQPGQQPPPRQPGQQPQPQATQAPGQDQSAAAVPAVRAVEDGDEYVHVQFRDPDEFDTIRTPDWAAHVAQSVAPGSEVRTGKLAGSDEWVVESVLVEKPVDRNRAVEQARQIYRKIES